jgi:hypothetical protein
MTTFLDELCGALAGDEPESFTLERDLSTGDAASPRLAARLTWHNPEEGTQDHTALDATCLDRVIDSDDVLRFAKAAAALGLERRLMLSGHGAGFDAVRAAAARGVDMVFVRANPRGARVKKPHVLIYPVVNRYVFEGESVAKALSKRRWEQLHMRVEEDEHLAEIRDADGGELATFRDLMRSLPLDRPAAYIGPGFEGKEPAHHRYAFEGARLVVPGFPEIAIQGVSFDYWVEIRPLEAKTRAEAFADVLFDKLADDD